MNKVELISKVTERINTEAEEKKVTKKAITEVVDAVFHEIGNALVDEEKVAIAGFGAFTIAERAERDGRNPRTGEALVIPASKAVRFKASSILKEAVNQ